MFCVLYTIFTLSLYSKRKYFPVFFFCPFIFGGFCTIIDLEKYIDKNSEADKYASHKVFGCIFDEEYLNRFVNFKEGKNRLALTVEFEFDKNGKFKNTNVYESVINVNESIDKEDEKTLKLKNIFENLFGFEDNNTKQKLHHFIEEQLAIICEENRIPVIFKNINLDKSIEFNFVPANI